MIAHIVLFRPRVGLNDAERAAFLDALEHAFVNIPLIRRVRVGRRITLGRSYDAQNAEDFPFAAILEFDSAPDLRSYLEHPAHHALGEQFYVAADAALVCDFDLVEGARVRELLLA